MHLWICIKFVLNKWVKVCHNNGFETTIYFFGQILIIIWHRNKHLKLLLFDGNYSVLQACLILISCHIQILESFKLILTTNLHPYDMQPIKKSFTTIFSRRVIRPKYSANCVMDHHYVKTMVCSLVMYISMHFSLWTRIFLVFSICWYLYTS